MLRTAQATSTTKGLCPPQTAQTTAAKVIRDHSTVHPANVQSTTRNSARWAKMPGWPGRLFGVVVMHFSVPNGLAGQVDALRRFISVLSCHSERQ